MQLPAEAQPSQPKARAPSPPASAASATHTYDATTTRPSSRTIKEARRGDRTGRPKARAPTTFATAVRPRTTVVRAVVHYLSGGLPRSAIVVFV